MAYQALVSSLLLRPYTLPYAARPASAQLSLRCHRKARHVNSALSQRHASGCEAVKEFMGGKGTSLFGQRYQLRCAWQCFCLLDPSAFGMGVLISKACQALPFRGERQGSSGKANLVLRTRTIHQASTTMPA